MQRLLVVGAGPSQAPAIRLASKLGYEVVATDVDPDAVGFEYADHAEVVSIDDVEGTVEVARRYDVDGAITLATDIGVPAVAAVRDRLGLPGVGPETAHRATHKGAMMDACRAAGTSIPAYRTAGDLAAAREFLNTLAGPVVVKPTDSAGQRGVTVVEGAPDLDVAFEEAVAYASDDRALLQEFVPGPEINVTAVVSDGEINLLSLSNRITADPPHFGIALQHVSPPDIDEAEQAAVRRTAESAIEAIGIDTGIAYPQIVVGPDGPRLIEIAARIPGGQMREVAMYRSGVDQIRAAIYHAVGRSFTVEDVTVVEVSQAVAVRFFTELDVDEDLATFHRARNLADARSIPGVKDVEIRLSEGDDVPTLEDATARFGHVVAVGDARSAAIETANSAGSLVRFE